MFTHHRALTTCHLANIAIRLGRDLEWDPAAQRVVGDDRAQAMTAAASPAPATRRWPAEVAAAAEIFRGGPGGPVRPAGRR